MDDITETKTVWIASVNTDLTEGRGHQRILSVCESKETAMRIGRGKNVQGSNADVQPSTAFKIKNNWYVRGEIIRETAEDTQNRIKREAKESALEKAKKAGLSDDDLKALIQ